MTDKLKIKLSAQKNNDTLYTNWQISKLSNNFSEFYYKTILLNDLSYYISNGIEKRDIIIFNDSININNQYTKYKNPVLDLKSSSDIMKYYHLGSPVSLFPNKQILLVYEFFEAYRRYFSIVNKHKLYAGSKQEALSILYEQSKSDNVIEFNLVSFFVNFVEENNIIEDDSRKKCIKEIEATFKGLKQDLQKLLRDYKKHNSGQFNHIFNRYERPIIGIKTADDEIKLLGSDFFVQSEFNYSNSRFLETNLIKQNSPLEMFLTMSVLVIPSILLVLKEKKSLMEAQNKNGMLNQKILSLEQQIKEFEDKGQQENCSINELPQVPNDLIDSVNKKGKQIFDEFDAEVI